MTKEKMDRNHIKEVAIRLLSDEKECIHMIDDLFFQKGFPCSKTTFYDKELQKEPEIVSLIERNRSMLKLGLRKKWYNAGNPTTDIVLYKLTGTKEEREILNNSTVKIEGGENPIQIKRIFD